MGSLIYHAVAALAMLCQVVVVGSISLLKLSLTAAPGNELGLFIVDAAVVISWLAFTIGGFAAWAQRRWLVVAAPIGSLAVLLVIDWIASSTLHWYLEMGGP